MDQVTLAYNYAAPLNRHINIYDQYRRTEENATVETTRKKDIAIHAFALRTFCPANYSLDKTFDEF